MVDTEEQPRDPLLPAPPPPPPEYSASVRLPDYYADSPQAWFCSIDATGKWQDHLGFSYNRPSVMWDNLTALQPATVKEIQMDLFLRKLLCYTRDLINPREFQEPEDLGGSER